MRTESGIDPMAVLKLVEEINTFSNKMDSVFNYLEGDLRRDLNRSYGGAAADALMERTLRLAQQAKQRKQELIALLKNNIDHDLKDTQQTDVKLSEDVG